jgi:hypothetical protein
MHFIIVLRVHKDGFTKTLRQEHIPEKLWLRGTSAPSPQKKEKFKNNKNAKKTRGGLD